MPRHIKGYEGIGFDEGVTERNNCITYLKKHAELFPNKIALRWTSRPQLETWSKKYTDDIPHQSLSFEAFYEKVNRFAGGLLKLGVRKGDCVVIFLPMSVELYQAMFAVMQIGAISVFLDSWARRTHLGASADTVNPKAMISFEGAFEFCKEVSEIDRIPIKICAFSQSDKFTSTIYKAEQSDRFTELVPVRGDDTALITFTTGSSGKPKGANRTHQFLSAQHIALDATIPYADQDCDLPAFPIFSLNNLASGVTTIIPAVDIGSPKPEDPLILAAQMRSCKTNCCTLSPSMLVETAKYCAKAGIQLDFLRRVVTGGAPISKDDLRAFKAIAPRTEIWVLYGSTEVEPIAHIEANEILAQDSANEEGVNVGHFAEGLQYRFLKINRGNIEWNSQTKWEDLEVQKGQVGEIAVEGLHVCKNYYNYPEATKQTKIIDANGGVWHRTGDLGYLDAQGQLWIVGRVHNAIQRGSEWYFPVRAEILLKRLPFVKRAAFLGMPDPLLHEKTYAVVSLKEDLKPTESDLNLYTVEIKEALQAAGIKVDEALVVGDIPMDPRHHSKVEYAVLRETISKISSQPTAAIA